MQKHSKNFAPLPQQVVAQGFAYILTCVDPANLDTLVKIFNRRFGKGNYFMPTELGGVKSLVSPEKKSDKEFILRKMKTAAKVHAFDIVLLINHSNCGAYRLAGHTFKNADEEADFHKKEMLAAAKVVSKNFPGVKIEIAYFLKAKQKMAW